VLASVAALFALEAVERDRGWFLESGYLEPPKSRAIRGRVTALCREVRDQAAVLVDGFGIPDTLLPEIGRAAQT
jgi:acyl-CoA oxidase